MSQMYRVDRVAEILDVDRKQVYELIHADELEWTNLATKPQGRPRVRVSEEQIARFQARRARGKQTTAA
jgi:transposase